MTEPLKLLDNAFARHQNGDVDEARALYKQVLVLGESAEALHWLGILELQSGNARKAVEHLSRASVLDANSAQVFANLGNACFAAAQFEQAVKAYERSLVLNPQSPETWASLGNLMLSTERSQRAVECYKTALALNSGLAEVWRGLSSALLSRGQYGGALEAIGRAEQEHVRAGQPESLPLLLTRGNVLMAAGLTAQAQSCFAKVAANAPKFAQAHISLGGAHRAMGEFELAAYHCQQAIKLEPTSSGGHYALGLVQLDQGQLECAKESFERTLEFESGNGRAHRLIASLTKYSLEHPHLSRMQNELNNDSLSVDQRTHLHFGVGKALEDSRSFKKAFEHIQVANELHRQQTDYSIDHDERYLSAIEQVFTAEFIAQEAQTHGTRHGAPRPVFIVGMPRSGTSLIEQILASHPQVFGAGELDLIERCTEDALDACGQSTGDLEKLTMLQDCEPEDFEKIGQDYLSRVRRLAPESQCVVDKMPANFRHLGLIRRALPNAIFIHAKRHPMATCWSIYKNYFGSQGHAYSFEQTELGRYYSGYRKLMRHWDNAINNLYVVDYEVLVSEQEAVSRALVAHCDLDWDEACLDFHANKRPVRTLSASQVRQPMYVEALAQWENYSHYLQPLKEALAGTGPSH